MRIASSLARHGPVEVEPERAVAGPQHLRGVERHRADHQPADDRANETPADHGVERPFDQRRHPHRADADRRRDQAEPDQRAIVEERQRRDGGRGNVVRRADDRLGGERGGERRGEDGNRVGERIGADDELERVEGAGQRRAERRRDRASRPAPDQHPEILPAQARSHAQVRGEAGSDLRIARLETDRCAAAVRDHGLRRHEEALAQRHASAAQRVGLDRIDRRRRFPAGEPDVDRAEQKAAQHRRAKGGQRRDALGGAEANVEGNAEDPHMRGVDEAWSSRRRTSPRGRRRRSQAPSCRIRSRAAARARSRAQSAPDAARRSAGRDVPRRSPCSDLCAGGPALPRAEDVRGDSVAAQRPESAMSSRWIISARPAVPRICAMSRELRPRMRSACRAS